jgi:MerR family mercuric resistance operon transcriptional regulator
VETLRFYERRGLLPEPPRTHAGYRLYPCDAIQRVRFIRRGKALGFSLAEIAELLALKVRPGVTCERVRVLAETKRADIERRIHELERMHQALGRLAADCTGSGPTTDCPIIDALEHEPLPGSDEP